jgi:signal transduction histidine kinase
MKAGLEAGRNDASIGGETDPARDLMPKPDGIVEDAWIDRTKAFVGRFSVKTKILGIVLTLTTILGLGITWQVRDATRDLAESELLDRGGVIAAGVAAQVAEPLMGGDNRAVAEVLDYMLTADVDTVFIAVSRLDGVIIGTAVVPGSLPAEALEEALEDSRSQRDGLFTFSSPVAENAGLVTVGMTDTRLVRTINGVTLQLLLTTLFVGAIGIVAAILLTWLLTRPIVELVETTHLVSQGDLKARATVFADDEIGTLAVVFNRMVGELERSRGTIAEAERARKRLLEQIINVQEDERKRIARELHDGVGQSLSSIMLAATMIERSDSSPRSAAAIRETAAETLVNVRRLGRELRPSVLDDLGLVSALDRHTAEFRLRYPEIEIEFHSELAERVSPAMETTMYRVIQEAMTNVARHSGARSLSVLIIERGDAVRAIIEDDGSGFDPLAERRNANSVGIHGMMERVELLGGRLDIESSITGTTVYVAIPLVMTGSRA